MNALGEIKHWKSGVTCEQATGMRIFMAGQYKCLPSMHKALTFNPWCHKQKLYRYFKNLEFMKLSIIQIYS